MSVYGSRVVYDAKNVPDRNINARIVLSPEANASTQREIIYYSVRELSEKLVTHIRDTGKFFKVTETKNGYTEIDASAIVLTHDEFQEEIEKAFRAGMECNNSYPLNKLYHELYNR